MTLLQGYKFALFDICFAKRHPILGILAYEIFYWKKYAT